MWGGQGTGADLFINPRGVSVGRMSVWGDQGPVGDRRDAPDAVSTGPQPPLLWTYLPCLTSPISTAPPLCVPKGHIPSTAGSAMYCLHARSQRIRLVGESVRGNSYLLVTLPSSTHTNHTQHLGPSPPLPSSLSQPPHLLPAPTPLTSPPPAPSTIEVWCLRVCL